MGQAEPDPGPGSTLDRLAWVDGWCDRYEAAWRAGRPPVEAFLRAEGLDPATVPPDLARELARVEAAHRAAAGDRPAPGEYARRFPQILGEVTVPDGTASFRPDGAAPTRTYAPDDPTRDGSDRPAGRAGRWPAVPGYEVLEELGRGGMGTVYRARQVAAGRVVALKVVRDEAYASAAERGRLRTEAQAVARLVHPHVVQLFEAGEHAGLPHFSMEYCPGGSLAGRLAGARLDPPAAARLLRDLAGAVQAAHDRGVVHRDLKPGNVLFDAGGVPKVADFGLARLDAGDGYTVTGARFGTPSYMSPEQARDAKGVGPATDVYALGAILYECLTGRPPFKGTSTADTLTQLQTRDPVPARRLVPGVPRDLETVCQKCLEKEPHRRYPSAAALADDLDRWLRGEPVRARPVGRAERLCRWARRRPAAAALWLTLLAAVLGAVAGGVYVRNQARAHREAEANGLVTELLDADTAKVPDVVGRMARHRDRVDPRLRDLLRSGDLSPGQRTHVRLALLPADAAQADGLADDLSGADLLARPAAAAVVCEALLREKCQERVADRMERVLDEPPPWAGAPPDPAWGEPDGAVRLEIEKADGDVAGRFAWCQTLPLDRLERVARALDPAGYRLVRVRPYGVRGEVRAAAVWARDGLAWGWVKDASPEQIQESHGRFGREGFAPTDLAGYETPGGDRYVAVWGRTGVRGPFRLDVGRPDAPTKSDPGHVPLTRHLFVSSGGSFNVAAAVASAAPSAAGDLDRQLPANGVRLLSSFILTEEPGRIHETPSRGPVKDVFQDPKFAPLQPVDAHVWATRPLWSKKSNGYADRQYAAVYHDHGESRVESRVLYDLNPAELRAHGRLLAAEGYRPVAVSVDAVRPPAPPALAACAVWHRPFVPDGDRDAFARRQAGAAAVLLTLGRPGRAWELFRHTPDPRRRTFLIHLPARLGVDPAVLVARLGGEPDLSARRALLLCLGEFAGERRPAEADRRALADRLRQDARGEADPGYRSAAGWLLGRWGDAATPRPAVGRQWYVTSEGHTMAVLPSPAGFLMGDPDSGPVRAERIPRPVAVATRKVTVAQYRRFWEDPKANRGKSFDQEYGSVIRGDNLSDESPMVGVGWYDAVRYCRWLSEREGVAEDQMCFPEVGHVGWRMTLPGDFLRRSGYRLPTEAEWEFACRAGASTPRFYGSSDDLLGFYTRGGGKPNDFGLFETYGPAWEWCQDAVPVPQLNYTTWVVRGGGPSPRSGRRWTASDSPHVKDNPKVGLRIARTMPAP